MILAELEIRHSRPIAPTRRVALGHRVLPMHPAPGFGGVLLAGVVAGHLDGLDPDLVPELRALIGQVGAGERVPQPRLRHRFQVDTHGLVRTKHALRGHGQTLAFDFAPTEAPIPQILGAVYAAGQLVAADRSRVVPLLHKALRWSGPAGPALVTYLLGGRNAWSGSMLSDPEGWALDVLGFGERRLSPARREVQRRFRDLVRAAHPDHGGDTVDAAQRVTDLTEARRILLG